MNKEISYTMKILILSSFLFITGCGGSKNSQEATEIAPSAVNDNDIEISIYYLLGDDEPNTLEAGGGISYLVGGYGDDTYVFRKGDGPIIVSEFDDDLGIPRPPGGFNPESKTGQDVLIISGELYRDDIYFERIDDNLVIYINNNNDSVTIKKWFVSNTHSVEFLRFDNDNEVNLENIDYNKSPSEKSNWLVGKDESDSIYGYNGDDYIFGLNGNDYLYGGEGRDEIYGGLGADFIDGGDDIDAVFYMDSDEGVTISLANEITATGGSAAGDELYNIEELSGSLFDDLMFGDFGNNKIFGKEGDDEIHGLDGVDEIYGGAGKDKIYGGKNSDFLYGESDDDFIYGGAGTGFLYGGDGDDVLYGGLNGDLLDGGEGDDIMYGEEGEDFYLFRKSFGSDQVNEVNYFDKVDSLLFEDFEFYDLWFYVEGEDLVVKSISSKDKVVITKYNDINIEMNYKLKSIGVSGEDEYQIKKLSKENFNLVIFQMSKSEIPSNKNEFPMYVLELIEAKADISL